jgi:hypothetical protein
VGRRATLRVPFEQLVKLNDAAGQPERFELALLNIVLG